MKEILSLHDAKIIMKNLNVIIYGTVRNIESEFLTSFTNIDLICGYFKKVYIIILENDSIDNTRQLLIKWSKGISSNISKHLILKQDLDRVYPLRGHRLAYCRNLILNYISDNNLNIEYNYAIHCDLDNRFWAIDYESICNCFQYNLNDWEMMSCVNKNRTYYDFWALRCDKSWFNINIFSCAANNVDYTTKIEGFETLLKNTSGLIPTTSSFNGLAVYKLNAMLSCRYNSDYSCKICNNINRGCWEDNDHIGLHQQMINNKYRLFINNKMYIQTRPENCIPYNNFIDSISIPQINKNPLIYLLLNNKIDNKGNWIMFGINDGDDANLITNYYNQTFYCFDSKLPDSHLLLNKNISVIKGNINETISNTLDKNDITFIYINCYLYQDIKSIFNSLYKILKPGCIILFNKLINYPEYLLNGIKVLYENIYEYEIIFEWLLMNGNFNKDNTIFNHCDQNQMVAIKILDNKNINKNVFDINYSSDEYENFDWVFYSNNYSDLTHIKTKEESFIHWNLYGINEGRVCQLENEKTMKIEEKKENEKENEEGKDDHILEDNFDWEMYVELNPDLKEGKENIKKEDAIRHWIKYGYKEGRIYYFDWCLYVKNYNLVSKSIDTKIKAINHWLSNGKPIISNKTEHDYNNELFDWELYVNKYDDLKHINSFELALNHWENHGKKEGRIGHNFKWTNYLLLNNDLLEAGINTEALALTHYICHGRGEHRKIN